MHHFSNSALRQVDILFDIFSRETTNIHEANTAARRVDRILRDAGVRPSDALRATAGTATLRAHHAEQLREHAEKLRVVETERDALREAFEATAAVARKLQETMQRMTGEGTSPGSDRTTPPRDDQPQTAAPAADDAPIDQADGEPAVEGEGHRQRPGRSFEAAAVRVAGRRYWQSAFAAAARIPVARLRRILATGVIPQRYWDLLEAMTAADWVPASRKRWTDGDRALLRKHATSGVDDVTLARILTDRLGRRVREGGVARQRRRLGIPACRLRP